MLGPRIPMKSGQCGSRLGRDDAQFTPYRGSYLIFVSRRIRLAGYEYSRAMGRVKIMHEKASPASWWEMVTQYSRQHMLDPDWETILPLSLSDSLRVYRIYSPGCSELLDSETHFSYPISPGSFTIMSCGADMTITIFDRINAFVLSS